MKQYKVKINLSDNTSIESGVLNVPNKTSDLTNDSGFITSASGLIFSNVSASNWTSSSTYSDYSYQCALSCSGITANSFVEVVFAPTEANSGNYAPVCLAGNNTVTIYSKVNTSITVKTVKEIK